MREVGSGITQVGLVLSVAWAAIVAGAPPLAAQVTIDNFSQAQGQIVAPPTVSSSQAGAGILGGTRGMEVSRTAGSAGNVTGEVAANQLQFDVLGAADRGRLFVSWDGDGDGSTLDEGGLGGADLTAGGSDTLRITVDAATGVCELVVEVYTDASNSSRSATTATAAGDLFFPFDSFSTRLGAGADFTSVGAITLEILDGGVGACDLSDFQSLGPDVQALKTDAILVDSDADGEADPGETLSYQIDITSQGGTATDVELVDTVGSDLTFVGGSIQVTPVAVDDSYLSVGNVQLSIAAGSGVLINDFDPDAALPSPPISAFDAVSLQGGIVALNTADGSFTYDSPALFSGVDSFTYTVTDADGLSDTAKVNIFIEGVIWFVDDTNGCPGTGTQVDPFCDFATNLNGVGGVGDVDAEDDIIFVFEGSGDTDTGDAAGFELENGQTLHGEGVELMIGGNTIVAAGNNPVLTNTAGTAGHGITLAQDNTIRGLSVGDTNAGSSAFTASADVGSLTIEDSDVSGTGGIFNVPNGGTLDVTFDSLASSASLSTAGINISGVTGSLTVDNPGAGTDTSIVAAGAGISIQNSGGAAFSFGETLVGTDGTGGNGIDLGSTTGNPGATFTFDDLSVTVGAGNGLVASDSGTLNVGGSASTISAVAGAALDIDTTTLDNGAGGGGATFASLTSASSSTEGVNLDTVSGDLTVTGTTTASASTGAGIRLTDSGGGFTFGNVDIDNPGGGGIFASAMSGQVTFSGASKTVTNAVANAVVGVDLVNSDVDFTNGGLDIDTTAGIGFRATGGGTINVTGAGNTIDVSGMAPHALDLDGVTIGANDVTFESITGTNGITAEGIDIDAVSNAGTFNGGDVTLTSTGGNGIDIAGSSAVFNFTSANITNSVGAGINLSGANGVVTFSAVDIDGSNGAAIAITSNTNAVSVNGGVIGASADNGAAVPAVDIETPAANVTIAAAITNVDNRAVEVTGPGAGSIDFAGAIDEDGTGINLATNGSATITFRGGIDLDTSTNTAFSATGGGTVNVCATVDCAAGTGVVNTIDTGAATAVNIQATTIGANGVTLRSVNVNGGTVGIDIDGGGTSGFFTVTGTDTTAGTGGTIQNTTENGILIENTNSITLTNMNLTNATDEAAGCVAGVDQSSSTLPTCTAALEFNVVSGIDVTNMTIDGDGDASDELGIFAQDVTDFDMDGVTVQNASDGLDEHGIYVVDLLGTSGGSTDSNWHDVVVTNTVGDTGILMVQTAGAGELLIDGASSIVDAFEGGFEARTDGASANLSVTIGDASAVGVGDTVVIDNPLTGAAFFAQGGTLTGTVRNSILRSGAGSATIDRTGAGSGTNGVLFVGIAGQSTDPTADIILNVTGNDIDHDDGGAGGTGRSGIALSGTGNVNGTITNNTVDSDDEFVDAFFMNFTGVGTTSDNQVLVDSNMFTMVGSGGNDTIAGIEINAHDSTGGLSVTVTDNDITSAGDNGFSAGIVFVVDDFGGTADNNVLCVDVFGNDATTPTAGAFGDYGIVQFDTSTFNLAGAGAGVLTEAQIDTYIVDNDDPGATTTAADVTVVGTINGVASCP